MNEFLTLIAEDREVVSYRPRLNKMTGSVTATILLQQILFRWKHNGCKPFYKFYAPCQHSQYREGDSWQEEIGFTRREFESARDAIAEKVTTGTSKTELRKTAIVLYWTDREHRTWYDVNADVLNAKLAELYSEPQSLSNVQNVQQIENEQNEQQIVSESTTEINNKNSENPIESAAWNELREILVIVNPMDIEGFRELWQDGFDLRRHKFALEQTKLNANPVSFKYYRTVYLRFNPDHVKPERPKPKQATENHTANFDNDFKVIQTTDGGFFG